MMYLLMIDAWKVMCSLTVIVLNGISDFKKFSSGKTDKLKMNYEETWWRPRISKTKARKCGLEAKDKN